MTRWLLDTNVLSDLLRTADGPVGRNIADKDDDAIVLSVLVASEIEFGIEKSGSTRLRRSFDELLARHPVTAFAEPAHRVYGALRETLRANGTPLGANDLFIAAHALALDAVLVTDDQAFLQVPGLKLENWLR